jgi:agmatinase
VSALFRPYNLDLDVRLFDHCSGVDYGDLSVVPGYIEDSYKRIEEELFPLVDAQVIPILLGGDHSITLPELRAFARKYGPIGLIHFDSHTDTYDEYFGRPHNHGTPFSRAAEENLLDGNRCIQVGMRGSVYSKDDYEKAKSYGFELITMTEVREIGIPDVIAKIRATVGDARVFVTFDIDAVDPAFAPGTGTPEVGGFTSGEALSLVKGLNGLDIVGFDIVEVLPEYDPADITALLAANIAYQFISIIAAKNKQMS